MSEKKIKKLLKTFNQGSQTQLAYKKTFEEVNFKYTQLTIELFKNHNSFYKVIAFQDFDETFKETAEVLENKIKDLNYKPFENKDIFNWINKIDAFIEEFNKSKQSKIQAEYITQNNKFSAKFTLIKEGVTTHFFQNIENCKNNENLKEMLNILKSDFYKNLITLLNK